MVQTLALVVGAIAAVPEKPATCTTESQLAATFCEDLTEVNEAAGTTDSWSFSEPFGEPKQCLGGHKDAMWAVTYPDGADCLAEGSAYLYGGYVGSAVVKDPSKVWDGDSDTGSLIQAPDEAVGASMMSDDAMVAGIAWTNGCPNVTPGSETVSEVQAHADGKTDCFRIAAAVGVQHLAVQQGADSSTRHAYVEGFEQKICAAGMKDDGSCPTTAPTQKGDMLGGIQLAMGGNGIPVAIAENGYKAIVYRERIVGAGYSGSVILLCVGDRVCDDYPFTKDCTVVYSALGNEVTCAADAAWQEEGTATAGKDVKAFFLGAEKETTKERVSFKWVFSKVFNTYLVDLPHNKNTDVMQPQSTTGSMHYVHSAQANDDGQGIIYIDTVFPIAGTAFEEISASKTAFLYALNNLGNTEGMSGNAPIVVTEETAEMGGDADAAAAAAAANAAKKAAEDAAKKAAAGGDADAAAAAAAANAAKKKAAEDAAKKAAAGGAAGKGDDKPAETAEMGNAAIVSVGATLMSSMFLLF